MTQRILITGAGGQLGRAIANELSGDHHVDALGRDDGLDIVDPDAVREVVRGLRPECIINCAAWTQVDVAEERPEEAYRANDEALGWLADAARAAGAWIVHFSTDYVFDGETLRPYVESDEPAPLSVYGASKLAGERRLQAHGIRAVILRTSWLYSDSGANFLTTMLRLAAERERDKAPLRVVDDQVGTPTDVFSLARQVRALLETDFDGLFHASSEGQASWCEFARAIVEGSGRRVDVVPVTTAEFPRPARRPAYSVLANARLEQLGATRMPEWRDGLRAVMKRSRLRRSGA